MTLICVDIETIPNVALLPNAAVAMPAPTAADAPGTYSKPESIAAWVTKANAGHQEKIAKRMSLDPLLGRIICIGTLTHDAMDGKTSTNMFTVAKGAIDLDTEERSLLMNFWNARATADTFLTFNGTNFDLPYIEMRSRILGISFTPIPAEQHKDLMRLTSIRSYGGGYENKSLSELRAWFGFTSQTPHTGADVWTDYQAGDLATIELHCLDDITATFEIAKKLNLV